MKTLVIFFAFISVAHAETPRSPYHITWSFPADEPSAIDVDRGDLSVSRFETDYELVQWLGTQPKAKKKPKPGATATPSRDLRVDQLDGTGKTRTTTSYTFTLPEWRTKLGERMVERLEDEFDAHLRMLLPRKVMPKSAAPTAPPDMATP